MVYTLTKIKERLEDRPPLVLRSVIEENQPDERLRR